MPDFAKRTKKYNSSENISKDDYNYVKERIKTCFDLIDYARKNKKF